MRDHVGGVIGGSWQQQGVASFGNLAKGTQVLLCHAQGRCFTAPMSSDCLGNQTNALCCRVCSPVDGLRLSCSIAQQLEKYSGILSRLRR